MKPLQFTGKNGTYIVPKIPEAVLGRGHIGEVYKGLENASETVHTVKIPAHRKGTSAFEGDFEEVVKREKRNMRLSLMMKICSLLFLGRPGLP